jgi:hypothetical protein
MERHSVAREQVNRMWRMCIVRIERPGMLAGEGEKCG